MFSTLINLFVVGAAIYFGHRLYRYFYPTIKSKTSVEILSKLDYYEEKEKDDILTFMVETVVCSAKEIDDMIKKYGMTNRRDLLDTLDSYIVSGNRDQWINLLRDRKVERVYEFKNADLNTTVEACPKDTSNSLRETSIACK